MAQRRPHPSSRWAIVGLEPGSGPDATGHGIINNQLYIGKLVWNRLRYIKDPDTGKRVSRLNPQEAWVVSEVPGLRIVDDALWARAKARQARIAREYEAVVLAARAHHAVRAGCVRRPRYLLSGRLACGVCGGTYAIMAKDRYGCANRTRHKGCTNTRTVRRQVIEARVLEGLKERLLSPAALAEAERGFREELRRRTREDAVAAEANRQTVEAATRGIREIVGIIEEGGGRPALLARLDDLEREKAAAEARRKHTPARRPRTPFDTAEAYRRKIARLAETLNDPDTRLEAGEAIRSQLGRVVLTPGAKRGEMHISPGPEPGAASRTEDG